MLPLKRINYLAPMLVSGLLLVLLISGFLEFPSLTTPLPATTITAATVATAIDSIGSRPNDSFTDLLAAFSRWDSEVSCSRFEDKYKGWTVDASVIQDPDAGVCAALRLRHVRVVVKGWTWIPDSLDGLYSCRCGMSCLWTKSAAVVDRPDALLFENVMPPIKRLKGDPLRVYVDLEASRKRSGSEDIFIGYHAKDDVQTTYAGKSFHISRNYHVSSQKKNDILVYWSSSRCLPHRDQLAKSFLSLVPHHSFGKCLNNVGGLDMALSLYPDCSSNENSAPHWWDHLHCSMSHYKFVLAIENTKTESYVTEKLFYALEAGAVPIYFGAPNVWDFVPPNSIIDGSKFSSIEELASYVKKLADDPVAYAEYHAWRRCGVLGNYGKTRAASLDTVPCRLCELVSRKGGRNMRPL